MSGALLAVVLAVGGCADDAGVDDAVPPSESGFQGEDGEAGEAPLGGVDDELGEGDGAGEGPEDVSREGNEEPATAPQAGAED